MLSIKEDDKFFSRLLSKESSISNPSFRVYYGGNSVGVPFVWEAKPGTPKHAKRNTNNVSDFEEGKNYVPPLTPPPSFYVNEAKKLQNDRKSLSSSSSKVFQGLFPKMMHKRHNSLASSSLSSSSTLSSFSFSSAVSTAGEKSRRSGRNRTLSNSGSLIDLFVNGHEEECSEEGEDEGGMESPKSVMCFGFVSSRKARCGSGVDYRV